MKSYRKHSVRMLSLALLTVFLFGACSQRTTAAKEASLFNGSPPQPANAKPGLQMIPLGTPFGIKLFTDGVIVVSFSDLPTQEGTRCPAKEAGILPGDYVRLANGLKVKNIEMLSAEIGAGAGQPLTLSIRRNDESFETTIQPVFSGGAFRTGMWVRDSAAGIGTLTFYNPETGVFAGLGHGICDADTGSLMTLDHGEPADITLCGIEPGRKEQPGQLQGYFTSGESMGNLLANNETGVYGTLKTPPPGTAMTVLPKKEVVPGPVQILVSVDEEAPKYYDAQIDRINPKDQNTQNMVITVTDTELIQRTGGIVQGMSGSPIIQNGKLAGAVTHVFVEDPTKGYGIFAETMARKTVELCMSD